MYFVAQELKIDPFKLFLAALFVPEVRTSDHQGPIKAVTFTAIANYLKSNGLAQTVINVEL